MFLERHQIGHHLTRMREPRQAVDDRHGGVVRQLHQRVVIQDPDHDDVDKARQHARSIGNGLAAAELHFGAGQHHNLATKLAHPDLERYPGAGRGLFENHRQRLVFQRSVRLGIALQLGLHRQTGIEHVAELGGRKRAEVEEVAQ
jgi:hypothetical protein